MEIPSYQAIRHGDSVALPLDLAIWRLTGPDRVRWLNGQITNQVVDLEVGETRRAAVCSSKGRMQGDIWISVGNEAFWITAPRQLQESLGQRLDMYLIADDCELIDVTEEWQVWHVFNGAGNSSSAKWSCANPYRFGWKGTDVWFKAEAGQPSLEETMGASVAAEALRLEHALPAWGSELDEKTLPPEAGYNRFGISYTKGCYVGQETIARIKSIGHVNRQLCCLVGPDQNITPGDVLLDGVKRAATVTSVAYSPEAESTLALAYVRRSFAEIGQKLELEGKNWEIVPPPLALEGVAA